MCSDLNTATFCFCVPMYVNIHADLPAVVQTFAGDVGHLWKTSESLLVYQELVRKGVRGLM